MSLTLLLLLLGSSPAMVELELLASDVEPEALTEIEHIIEARLRSLGREPKPRPCEVCRERLQVIVVAGIARTNIELRSSDRAVVALIPAHGGRAELEELVELWARPITASTAPPPPKSDALLWGLAAGAGIMAITSLIGALVSIDATDQLQAQPRFGAELDRLEARAEVGRAVAASGLCISGLALGGVLLFLSLDGD